MALIVGFFSGCARNTAERVPGGGEPSGDMSLIGEGVGGRGLRMWRGTSVEREGQGVSGLGGEREREKGKERQGAWAVVHGVFPYINNITVISFPGEEKWGACGELFYCSIVLLFSCGVVLYPSGWPFHRSGTGVRRGGMLVLPSPFL